MAYNVNRRSSLTVGERLMFLAGILFCLILITIALMGGMFARYLTTSDGEDSARVAKFNPAVLLNHKTTTVHCVENENGTFTLTVDNKSEVAVRYEIVVTLENELTGVSAGLYPHGSNEQDDLINPDTEDPEKPLTMTFSNSNLTLPAGGEAKYDLVFTVDWTKTDFTVNNTDGDTTRESVPMEFDVDVTVEQID